MPTGVVQRGGTQQLSPVAFMDNDAIQIVYVSNPDGPSGRPLLPGTCVSFTLTGGNATSPAVADGRCGSLPEPYFSGGNVEMTWQARRRVNKLLTEGVITLGDLSEIHWAAELAGSKISVPLLKSRGY